MRVQSFVLPTAFAAAAFVALASIGCGSSNTPPPRIEPSSGSGDPNVDVGELLYPAKPAVKFTGGAVIGNEPLVIGSCPVQFDQRQMVSAEVDGKIELLAVLDDDINPTDHVLNDAFAIDD